MDRLIGNSKALRQWLMQWWLRWEDGYRGPMPYVVPNLGRKY